MFERVVAMLDSEGRCTQFVHDRSRMTIDLRIPSMPGRSTWGFHQPGRRGEVVGCSDVL